MDKLTQALAEGMDSLGPTLPDNAYISEHLAATPSMQDIARLALIGAAWERLEMHGLARSLEPSLWLTPDHTYQAALGGNVGAGYDLFNAIEAAIAATTEHHRIPDSDWCAVCRSSWPCAAATGEDET